MKAVLVHNGNELPSVPLAHVVGLKETYESMQLILRAINYDNYNWKICVDLKVVALLLGLQAGWTKHCCFLCLKIHLLDSHLACFTKNLGAVGDEQGERIHQDILSMKKRKLE